MPKPTTPARPTPRPVVRLTLGASPSAAASSAPVAATEIPKTPSKSKAELLRDFEERERKQQIHRKAQDDQQAETKARLLQEVEDEKKAAAQKEADKKEELRKEELRKEAEKNKGKGKVSALTSSEQTSS